MEIRTTEIDVALHVSGSLLIENAEYLTDEHSPINQLTENVVCELYKTWIQMQQMMKHGTGDVHESIDEIQ